MLYKFDGKQVVVGKKVTIGHAAVVHGKYMGD